MRAGDFKKIGELLCFTLLYDQRIVPVQSERDEGKREKGESPWSEQSAPKDTQRDDQLSLYRTRRPLTSASLWVYPWSRERRLSDSPGGELTVDRDRWDPHTRAAVASGLRPPPGEVAMEEHASETERGF